MVSRWWISDNIKLMPAYTSEQAKEMVKGRRRDARGHFIKEASSLKAPAILPIPDFEKPLLQVSLNNPFKKILYWLDLIRRHQTTTLAFKLSIPLIALPLVIAGVFTLGRFSGISFQKTQQPAVIVPSPKPDPIVSRAGTLKIAVSAQTKYLLAVSASQLIVLEIPPTINLSKYNGKQVLVTGTYNSTANVIKVTDIAQVEVFNPTVIPNPEASSSAN